MSELKNPFCHISYSLLSCSVAERYPVISQCFLPNSQVPFLQTFNLILLPVHSRRFAAAHRLPGYGYLHHPKLPSNLFSDYFKAAR